MPLILKYISCAERYYKICTHQKYRIKLNEIDCTKKYSVPKLIRPERSFEKDTIKIIRNKEHVFYCHV